MWRFFFLLWLCKFFLCGFTFEGWGFVCGCRTWVHVAYTAKWKKRSSENQNPRKDLDFALQTKKYFSIVRHLHNKGLNPQTELTIEHVYQANLNEVFGPLKQLKYKVTRPFFHLDTKKELMKLCWQTYGTSFITNNDLAIWVVRRFVTQKKR